MNNDDYVFKLCSEAIAEGILDKYDLSEIYDKAFKEYFRKSYSDFYLDHEGNKWKESSVGFETSDNATLAQVLEAFEKHINNYSGGADVAKLKSKFERYADNLWYLGNGELKQYFRYDTAQTDNLFYILDYILNGEIGKDLGRVQTIMKNHGLSSSVYAYSDIFKEFGNIQIIALKNGKIKIKGLSSEEESALQDLFDIVKK